MEQSQVINRASLQRSADHGLYVVSLARTGCDEHFVTAPLLSGEQPGSLFNRAAEALRDRGAAIVSMEVAGVPYEMAPLIEAFGPVAWPVTWFNRSPAVAAGGIHVWAVAGPAVTSIEHAGVVTGTRFEDAWATYCRIGGLVPEDHNAAPAIQTLSILNAKESTLRDARMNFSDVVRTWFYNRSITAWYDQFNRARNRFFNARGVFQCLVPASTGVGGGDIGGAALTAGLLAVRPRDARVRIEAVDSPMQCPATNYGSAFSRAVEVAFPDHVRLIVSGTASISPRGQTEHAGDVAAQVDETVDIVGALLASRDMYWDDVTEGIAYVKRADDAGAVAERFARKGMEGLPIIFVHADICRDDLLFEIEVTAIAPRAPDHEGFG